MLIVLLINDAIENSKILCYLIMPCSFPKAFLYSMPQYNAFIQLTSYGVQQNNIALQRMVLQISGSTTTKAATRRGNSSVVALQLLLYSNKVTLYLRALGTKILFLRSVGLPEE